MLLLALKVKAPYGSSFDKLACSFSNGVSFYKSPELIFNRQSLRFTYVRGIGAARRRGDDVNKKPQISYAPFWE